MRGRMTCHRGPCERCAPCCWDCREIFTISDWPSRSVTDVGATGGCARVPARLRRGPPEPRGRRSGLRCRKSAYRNGAGSDGCPLFMFCAKTWSAKVSRWMYALRMRRSYSRERRRMASSATTMKKICTARTISELESDGRRNQSRGARDERRTPIRVPT